MILIITIALLFIIHGFLILYRIEKIQAPTKRDKRKRVFGIAYILTCFIGLFLTVIAFSPSHKPNDPLLMEKQRLYLEKFKRENQKTCFLCNKDMTFDHNFLKINDTSYECKECQDMVSKRIDAEDAAKRNQEKSSSDPYDGVSCGNCSLGKYRNGFCYSCGAASPYQVRERQKKMPNCTFCRGTGVEKTGFGEQRICPICKGSGKSRS